ncbi:hypothetical protein ACU686_40440 [Yinghuangia aomiensis]
MPNPYTFGGIARGETWAATFQVQDALERPVDLTGRVVTFVLRDTVIRARLVSGGEQTGGTILVTPAEGRITVTVDRAVTAAVASANWGLWLDEDTPTADAAAWGGFRTVPVVRSNA